MQRKGEITWIPITRALMTVRSSCGNHGFTAYAPQAFFPGFMLLPVIVIAGLALTFTSTLQYSISWVYSAVLRLHKCSLSRGFLLMLYSQKHYSAIYKIPALNRWTSHWCKIPHLPSVISFWAFDVSLMRTWDPGFLVHVSPYLLRLQP